MGSFTPPPLRAEGTHSHSSSLGRSKGLGSDIAIYQETGLFSTYVDQSKSSGV